MKKGLLFGREQRLLLLAFMIIVIGQIAQSVNSNSVILVALIITGLVSMNCQDNDLVPFMLYLIAPNRLLTYGFISAPTVVMILGVFKSVIFGRKFDKKFILGSFLLLAYSAITVFIGNPQIFDALKIIIMLMFFQLYTEYENIEKAYVKYAMCCSMGCIISSLIVLILNPDSVRERSRFTLFGTGQNVLGILCGIMAINLAYIFLTKRNVKNLKIIITVFFLLFIGFLTGSRSFLLVIAMGIVLISLFLTWKLKIGSLTKLVFILLVGSVIAWILYQSNSFINNYVTQLIYRITKLQNIDVSNGRYEIWEQYITIFKQYPLFLWMGSLLPLTYGIKSVAHNMIIEQIAVFGIMGSLIILALYLKTLKKIRQKSKAHLKWDESLSPVLTLFCVSMVSHTLLGVSQTVMLYISVLAMFRRGEKE